MSTTAIVCFVVGGLAIWAVLELLAKMNRPAG